MLVFYILSVYLIDNKIGIAGATSLCDALMVNTTLASLNFKGSKHIEKKNLISFHHGIHVHIF